MSGKKLLRQKIKPRCMFKGKCEFKQYRGTYAPRYLIPKCKIYPELCNQQSWDLGVVNVI